MSVRKRSDRHCVWEVKGDKTNYLLDNQAETIDPALFRVPPLAPAFPPCIEAQTLPSCRC